MKPSQNESQRPVPEGRPEEGSAPEAHCRSEPELQFCARCGRDLPPSGGMVVCPTCGLRQCPTCGA